MARKSNARLTARAREMYGLIERYLSGDLQQRDFCEQADIPLSTLHYWLYRYRTVAGSGSRGSSPGNRTGRSAGGFLALRPAAEVMPFARHACEVVLPNGIILRLSDRPDGAWLAELAAALRDRQ